MSRCSSKAFLASVSLALTLVASPAQTQNVTMATMAGSCANLTIGKHSYRKRCEPIIMNTAYPDGRIGFYFVLAGGKVITFSGMDGENPSVDTDVTHLDRVVINLKGPSQKPDVVNAKGTCTYGNPYKGISTVHCSGNLKDGRKFDAVFITDGAEPKISEH